MATYGSYEGVQALIRHMTPDAIRSITSADINRWLEQRSAELTACLVQAGYAVPVTEESAVAILNGYANVGAAALAELSQRFAGDTGEEGNRRYEAFLAEWNKACPWIAGTALKALGVPQTGTGDDVQLTFVPATYGGGNTPDEYARPVQWRET